MNKLKKVFEEQLKNKNLTCQKSKSKEKLINIESGNVKCMWKLCRYK